MNQQEAARVLREVLRDELPPGEAVFETVQENVFRLAVGGSRYLIKFIAAGDARGQNELRVGRVITRLGSLPAPRLAFEKTGEGGTIAGWEWVEGRDLREHGRERLAEAFAAMGRLHRAMRFRGPLVSPLTSASYVTVRDMLDAETYRLSAPFDAPTRARCARVFSRLEVGYPTLIHGDLHPGNIIAGARQVWFVDWSYACSSLNLFDLDYVQSVALHEPGPSWSVITPQEAAQVLPAYFEAAGLGQVDIYAAHLAVMLWNLLRTYDNAIKNGYHAEAEIEREQIDTLLARA